MVGSSNNCSSWKVDNDISVDNDDDHSFEIISISDIEKIMSSTNENPMTDNNNDNNNGDDDDDWSAVSNPYDHMMIYTDRREYYHVPSFKFQNDDKNNDLLEHCNDQYHIAAITQLKKEMEEMMLVNNGYNIINNNNNHNNENFEHCNMLCFQNSPHLLMNDHHTDQVAHWMKWKQHYQNPPKKSIPFIELNDSTLDFVKTNNNTKSPSSSSSTTTTTTKGIGIVSCARDFTDVIVQSLNQQRPILVNIQDYSLSSCCNMNQHIWIDETIQDLIDCHYVFWQTTKQTPAASLFIKKYNVTSYPYIAIMTTNPVTVIWSENGWTGGTIQQMTKLLSDNANDPLVQYMNNRKLYEPIPYTYDFGGSIVQQQQKQRKISSSTTTTTTTTTTGRLFCNPNATTNMMQRAVIAKRRGRCVHCGILTHYRHELFTMIQLNTPNVVNGTCIGCNPDSVNPLIYQEWKNGQQQQQKQQNDKNNLKQYKNKHK